MNEELIALRKEWLKSKAEFNDQKQKERDNKYITDNGNRRLFGFGIPKYIKTIVLCIILSSAVYEACQIANHFAKMGGLL